MAAVGWKSELDVALTTKNMVLVTGNIHDWQWSSRDGYTPMAPETLTEWLVAKLLEKGVERIYRFDILTGIEQIYPNALTEEDAERESGSDSRRTEESHSNNDPSREESGSASPFVASSGDLCILDQLQALNGLVKDRSGRTAVLVEHADKLFAHDQASQSDEKEIAVALIKLSRDPYVDGKMERKNPVILICDREDLMPRDLFKGNPDVKMIHIPLPGNEDRARFFAHNTQLFGEEYAAVDKNVFAGLTFDMRYKELFQLARLSRAMPHQGSDHPLSALPSEKAEELINYFRFGNQENPWAANLSSHRLSEGVRYWIDTYRFHGQDRALNKVIDLLRIIKADLVNLDRDSKRQPRGRMFFLGPTGTGKTSLCKKIARFLFGTEEACRIFAMGELKGQGAVKRLVGADPSFVGFEKGGTLTNHLREHPFAILVFDEVEKAEEEFWDLFLNILQEGKCTDGQGEIAYFNQSLIIFTSNLGMDLDSKNMEKLASSSEETVRAYFTEAVRKYFQVKLGKPELLGRIGLENIVAFNFLKQENFLRIIKDELQKLSVIEKRCPDFTVRIDSDRVAEYIYRNLPDRIMGGARRVSSFVRESIVSKLAGFLIERPGGLINITVDDKLGREQIRVECQ